MAIIYKIHKVEGKIILALCDSDLIGKVFEENNKMLDLSSNFYKGKEINHEEINHFIKISYIINAVGKETLDFLIKNDILEENNLRKIKNIPHAQIVIVKE